MEVSFIKNGNKKERTDFKVETLGEGKIMNSASFAECRSPIEGPNQSSSRRILSV